MLARFHSKLRSRHGVSPHTSRDWFAALQQHSLDVHVVMTAPRGIRPPAHLRLAHRHKSSLDLETTHTTMPDRAHL